MHEAFATDQHPWLSDSTNALTGSFGIGAGQSIAVDVGAR